jgi:hypothetical protein
MICEDNARPPMYPKFSVSGTVAHENHITFSLGARQYPGKSLFSSVKFQSKRIRKRRNKKAIVVLSTSLIPAHHPLRSPQSLHIITSLSPSAASARVTNLADEPPRLDGEALASRECRADIPEIGSRACLPAVDVVVDTD